jgi:hypothetical protein
MHLSHVWYATQEIELQGKQSKRGDARGGKYMPDLSTMKV